jgi:urea transporter
MKELYFWTRTLLRGLGQIMLQKSAVTGFFFLAGIAVNSLWMALGALLGDVVGTIFAKSIKYDLTEIEDGLYGFNGALVGIAMLFFLGPRWQTILLIVGGSAASTVIMHFMTHRLKVPPYTAPFVVATWGLFLVVRVFSLPGFISSTLPPLTLWESIYSPEVTSSVFTGIGQVMFQGNVFSGLFFLLGIVACSKREAMWTLAGSILCTAMAVIVGFPRGEIAVGILSYNGILTAIALSKVYHRAWVPAIGALLSFPLTIAIQRLAVIPLTAPFVLVTWIVRAVKDRF